MLAYRVDDMTCGHCASAITKAVRAVDAGARVEVNLAQHLVQIEPTEADAHELSEAITEAGYTPVPVELGAAIATAPRAGGCGCGSGSGASGCGS
jgi:copper chaperone